LIKVFSRLRGISGQLQGASLNREMAAAARNAACKAPALTALQRAAASLEHLPVPAKCVVTGGSGFVGQRLVEMLVERGAQRVVSFDIAPPPTDAWKNPRIDYMEGDLRNLDSVSEAVLGADCVWHLAAAVGPYHPKQLYEEVNVLGTRHVVEACRAAGVPKIVMSSSPSTRFDGSDIDGLTEDELPALPQKHYLVEYARTKALGEVFCMESCRDDLMTVAVAPHQVYGPRDTLFLPNILESAGTGSLRIFGDGQNRICFTHVDNYCHALILAERALVKGSPALGQFYICTDASTHPHLEGYCMFWEELERAIVGVGFTSLKAKFHLPIWLLMGLAYACNFVGFILRRPMKLSPFAVKMLTMHRWFRCDGAERDLGYKPIIGFKEGWSDTIDWFRDEWRPKFFDNRSASVFGKIYGGTEQKIGLQNKKLD